MAFAGSGGRGSMTFAGSSGRGSMAFAGWGGCGELVCATHAAVDSHTASGAGRASNDDDPNGWLDGWRHGWHHVKPGSAGSGAVAVYGKAVACCCARQKEVCRLAIKALSPAAALAAHKLLLLLLPLLLPRRVARQGI